MENTSDDIFTLDFDLDNDELLDLEIQELENRLAFDVNDPGGCTSGSCTCTPTWDP
jgi:hypothetical protein